MIHQIDKHQIHLHLGPMDFVSARLIKSNPIIAKLGQMFGNTIGHQYIKFYQDFELDRYYITLNGRIFALSAKVQSALYEWDRAIGSLPVKELKHIVLTRHTSLHTVT